MTLPRSLSVSNDESTYHCISRCVRRAFLCGIDHKTNKNFDHRKCWVQSRLQYLAGIFCVDVLSYALMSNHTHLMIRTRPDLVAKLTNEDVAINWLKLFPKKNFPAGSKSYRNLIWLISNDPARLFELRRRLSNISWFMKSLNEHIARKANREDKCKGRFWEGRFKCQRLCDDSALLSCAIYVDLNPIRAKAARSPEESIHTSAFERIQFLNRPTLPKKEPWLAPIQNTKSRKGFLPISIYEYLRLLDSTGREIISGKRGSIPKDIQPILVRLNINPNNWIRCCHSHNKCFSSAVGSAPSLRELAKKQGRSWLKGIRTAAQLFG